MFKSIRLRPVALVVSAILVALTFFLGRRPYYNWDMFPYMAVIMERPGVPFDSVHRDVYREAAHFLPPQDFRAISARHPELANDPEAFHDILKYFTIKPGYTTLAKVFHLLGIHPVFATCLPSLLGYLAIGLILFIWAQGQSTPVSGAVLSVLISISPPMRDLARFSSPDMLCAALSVGAFALMLKDRGIAGTCLLFLAVWVRPDSILLFVPMVVALGVTGYLPRAASFGFIIAGISSSWFILGGFGLIMEYIVIDPASSRWQLYWKGLGSLLSPYPILFTVFAVRLLWIRKGLRIPQSRILMLGAALGSLLVRFLLHPADNPVDEIRFNLPAYFLILMICCEYMLNWRRDALPKP